MVLQRLFGTVKHQSDHLKISQRAATVSWLPFSQGVPAIHDQHAAHEHPQKQERHGVDATRAAIESALPQQPCKAEHVCCVLDAVDTASVLHSLPTGTKHDTKSW